MLLAWAGQPGSKAACCELKIIGKFTLSLLASTETKETRQSDITMPSNVEIKARVPNLDDLLAKVREVCGSEGTRFTQEDTFFVCPNGRLKLRIEQDGAVGSLIYYNRSNVSGPKQSDYMITIINNPTDLKETLGQALGIKGCVRKVRQLFMYGQTRVHVDDVEGLGSYMELEVCLKPDQTLSEGQAIAEDLMVKLGISNDNLVTCAYIDLLNKGDSN